MEKGKNNFRHLPNKLTSISLISREKQATFRDVFFYFSANAQRRALSFDSQTGYIKNILLSVFTNHSQSV